MIFKFLPLALVLFCLSCQSFKPDANTNRLHDIWGLKEVDGKSIKQTQGGVLEIFVADSKFLFNTRSNNYEGKLRFKKDQQISFSDLSQAIPETSGDIEKQFLQVLTTVDHWKIHKRYLQLYNDEKIVARLIKMD